MKKKVKKTSEKYVRESTFEKHMGNIAKSFERVDAALDVHTKVLQDILKEIKLIHEDHKYFKQNISSLYSDGISYDKRINNVTVRLEKLESKGK